MCLCVGHKVPGDDTGSSRTNAKLGAEDNTAATADKSAERDRSPTPMQSSETLITAAESAGDSKSPAGVRDACEPAMKADRHIADMATLTVDDMVQFSKVILIKVK